MIKILTIVGARPQFIKAAALSRTINNRFDDQIREIIVHTGQHYDQNMSSGFFEELEIPEPEYYLEVGSGSHGHMTAKMLERIEQLLEKEKPDVCLVYGDTNTTLAGALAASKIHIPVAHVEAGLRSYNKEMPEEINRILTDHSSTFLFAPTEKAIENLKKEGFDPAARPPYSINNPKVWLSGDIMMDNLVFYGNKAEKTSKILADLDLVGKTFALCTIHRDFNTDNAVRLRSIIDSLVDIIKEHRIKIVLPLHPRTAGKLKNEPYFRQIEHSEISTDLIITPPLPYLDTLMLEKNSTLILTDSGGLQKEAYFFKKYCLILRPETEWTELLDNKAAFLVDSNTELIRSTFASLLSQVDFPSVTLYGTGETANFICDALLTQNPKS